MTTIIELAAAASGGCQGLTIDDLIRLLQGEPAPVDTDLPPPPECCLAPQATPDTSDGTRVRVRAGEDQSSGTLQVGKPQ